MSVLYPLKYLIGEIPIEFRTSNGRSLFSAITNWDVSALFEIKSAWVYGQTSELPGLITSNKSIFDVIKSIVSRVVTIILQSGNSAFRRLRISKYEHSSTKPFLIRGVDKYTSTPLDKKPFAWEMSDVTSYSKSCLEPILKLVRITQDWWTVMSFLQTIIAQANCTRAR